MTNRNNQPSWQTQPRTTKAQEKFLKEFRRNGNATSPGDLESRVREILARPGARTSTGMFDPRVVSTEDARLIRRFQSQQPQELTQFQRRKPITGPEALKNIATLRHVGGWHRTAFTEEEIQRLPGPAQSLARAANDLTSPFSIALTVATAGLGPAASIGVKSLQASLKTAITQGSRSRATQIAERIMRVAGPVVSAVTAPITRGGFGQRLAAEQVLGVGAGVAAHETARRIPETAPALVRYGAPLAAGLVGGGLTLGGIAGARAVARVAPAGARRAVSAGIHALPSELGYAAGPDFITVKGLDKQIVDAKNAIKFAERSKTPTQDLEDTLAFLEDSRLSAIEKELGPEEFSRLEGLREQITDVEGHIQALSVGGKVVRPRWAAGITNDQLKNIARQEGVNPYQADWGDALDPTVIREAKQRRYKTAADQPATSKELIATRAALKREIRAMEKPGPEVAKAPTEAAPTIREEVVPQRQIGAGQRGMGIGERPPQGELLAEFRGEGGAVPLADQEALAAAQLRREAVERGQQAFPEAPTVAPTAARLPRELAGAKPNYNMGQRQYTPQFESDVDRALFIVSQTKKSARDESYMEWLRGQLPDLSDVQLRAAGRDVRAHIKATVSGQPEGNVTIPASGIVREAAPTARAAPPTEAPTRTTAAPTARAATPDVPVGPAAREAVGGGVPPEVPVAPPATEGKALPSGRAIGGPGRGRGEPPPRDADAMFQDGLYPESDPFMARWKSKGSRVLEEVYDRNFSLQALEKQSGISAHQYAQLVPGAMGAGEDTVRRLFKPIIDSLRSADLPLLEKYMVLMRGGDVVARNPKALLPGGITNAERLRLLADMPAKIGVERFRTIKKAADDLWAATGHGHGDPSLMPADGNILELLNEGIISREMYTAMKSTHPHYIPWQRADFTEVVHNSFSAKPEANLSTTGIKRMDYEGSTRALSDPLNKLLEEPYRIKTIIFRNRAAKSIVRALEEIQRRTGEELVRYIEPKRAMRKVKGEISQMWETISFFENGVKNRVEVPSVYGRVAKGLEAEPSNFLVSAARILNAPLRYGATTFNPLFLPTNIIRDGMSAMFREKVFPFIGKDYLSGVWAVIRKNALYSEAAQSGALLSGIVENMNPTRFRVKATRATETGRLGLMGAITIPARATWQAIAAPFRLIEQANILAERGIRVGVFRKLRNEGIESLEAAIRSRDATVDFAKSGHTMRTINAVLPFTNAAIQGQANIARTIWNHPGRSGAFAGMFMSAVILERVNNMRFETSSLIPDYEYTRNWIIQFAEGRRKDGTQYPIYLRIPKGEIAAMATFPVEALMHLAREGEDRSVVEIMLDQGLEVAKIISPIDIGEPTGLIPPIFETAIGASLGVNPFTKTPLVPLGEKDLPPEQQFGDRTSTLAVQLGQKFKVSPRLIDFALRDVAAGTGQQVSWLVSMALEALMGRPPELGIDDPDADVRAEGIERLSKSNPFMSRFIGTRSTQLDRRGYSNLDDAERATQRAWSALPDVSRLGIKLGTVGNTIEDIELTPQQRAEYQGVLGAEAIRVLEAFIYTPSFKELEAIEKEGYIRLALEEARDIARYIMLKKITEQQPVAPTPTDQPSSGRQELDQRVRDFQSRTEDVPTRGMTQMQIREQRLRDFPKTLPSVTPEPVAR